MVHTKLIFFRNHAEKKSGSACPASADCTPAVATVQWSAGREQLALMAFALQGVAYLGLDS